VRINITPDEHIGPTKQTSWNGWRTESAPLKSNALQTLVPQLAKLGFATGPIQRRKTFLRVPIHWVYSSNRNNPPFRYYDSVGAVKIPCDGSTTPWKFSYTETCSWLGVFSQFFDRFLNSWVPADLFSSEGISEVNRFARAVSAGKRCPEPMKLIRYGWICHHPELWDTPREMLAEMKKYKLYRESTPECQALEHLSLWIERARKGEQPDGPLIPRERPVRQEPIIDHELMALIDRLHADPEALRLYMETGELPPDFTQQDEI
jgi:hypothetical protein